jgi:hypothetical protein
MDRTTKNNVTKYEDSDGNRMYYPKDGYFLVIEDDENVEHCYHPLRENHSKLLLTQLILKDLYDNRTPLDFNNDEIYVSIVNQADYDRYLRQQETIDAELASLGHNLWEDTIGLPYMPGNRNKIAVNLSVANCMLGHDYQDLEEFVLENYDNIFQEDLIERLERIAPYVDTKWKHGDIFGYRIV